MLPLATRLRCISIEPVVYLHPQKVAFETQIIGEGRSSYTKVFEIRNPHECDIGWSIEGWETEKSSGFVLSKTEGVIRALGAVSLEVVFQPQHEGCFS